MRGIPRKASSPSRTAKEAASESLGPSARLHQGSADATQGEDAADSGPGESRTRAEGSQARPRVNPGHGRLHSARPGPGSPPATAGRQPGPGRNVMHGRSARNPRSPPGTYRRRHTEQPLLSHDPDKHPSWRTARASHRRGAPATKAPQKRVADRQVSCRRTRRAVWSAASRGPRGGRGRAKTQPNSPVPVEDSQPSA